MKEEDFLKEKLPVGNAFRQPEGYLDAVPAKVMELLSETPTSCQVVEAPTSLWQRCRTYVYMAAFFAGAALLMKAASGYFEMPEPLVSDEEVEQARDLEQILGGQDVDAYTLSRLIEGEEYDWILEEPEKDGE